MYVYLRAELLYYFTVSCISRKEELEQFKSQINFCEYASSRGFSFDKKQSSRSTAVLSHANGDKLVIARGANRHWKYFNVHDDRDQGTIIDFVQIRDRLSLGEVRKELRSWVGKIRHLNSSTQKSTELIPSEHDIAEVLAAWEKASPIKGLNNYLELNRQIPGHILYDPVFANRMRVDSRHNILFAHYNSDGISGFEIKNRGFTGFSPGGIKGLFCSRPKPDDNELIICETAIDALSYATLFGIDRKRFLSTAGQVSPAQKQMLKSAAEKMPTGSTIVLAMDNDAGGRKLTEAVTQNLQDMNYRGQVLRIHMPERYGEDWNDVLRQPISDLQAVLTLG